jgi:serine/threonine-protein kinase
MAIKDVLTVCSEIKELDKGGQKVVYAAKHPEHGSVVLKKGTYAHHGALERIGREVDLLANIDSPYYPKHYAFIVEASTREFLIVEERIEGTPLNKCMERFNFEEKIIGLLKHLVVALNVLWEKRVVHRDVKPQNIIIKENGTPVVIDLGIARLLELSSITLSESPFGPCTPPYASPEQLLNRKEIIDARADFFSLGILILQLSLGFHPFDPRTVGEGDSIPDNILHGRYIVPDPTGSYSENFIQLIKRLLEVEPYQRFRNENVLSKFLSDRWG